MKRRDLVVTAITGTAASVALSGRAAAAESDNETNIVFSGDNYGHWTGMAAHHVPIVQINGEKISVRTPHSMNEAHYIVSHSVVLADGKFLDRKTFTWKDQPVSEHTLPAGYRGSITVTSTCNMHDIWVKTVTV